MARALAGADAPARHGEDQRSSPRIVFHIDMDAFYAAVHAREDPTLHHVPLVVGADPRGGRSRGVVMTANYHARRYGLHSAMPIGRAYTLCPHATYIRPDFSLYKPASQDVMAVLERYAEGGGVLQVMGMDEAYLDVTGTCDGDWKRACALARSLQAAVKRETGLSCSIGVAPNKATAKIASDHRKPHGVTVVRPDDLALFLDSLPVRLINGCGPKTAARLEEWEVRTIGDLARQNPTWLEERFGSHGGWLHAVANGHDDRPVTAGRGAGKSRGNERTYGRDQRDPLKILENARRLTEGLVAGKDRRAFATITVKLRYHDFTTLTRAHTLSVPLDPVNPETPELAWATVHSLLDPLLDGRPVRLVGVRLSGFTDATGQRRLSAYGIDMANMDKVGLADPSSGFAGAA